MGITSGEEGLGNFDIVDVEVISVAVGSPLPDGQGKEDGAHGG